jgi:hypothetical protein
MTKRHAETRDGAGASKRVTASAKRRGAAHQLTLPLDADRALDTAAPNVTLARQPARTDDTVPALVAPRAAPIKSAPNAAPSAAAPSVPTLQRARPSGPREGRGNVKAHFAELRAALEDGWEIVQPIFARPMWTAVDDSATELHFVLRRDVATRLLTVPEGRGVQRFIRERHLAVNYPQ